MFTQLTSKNCMAAIADTEQGVLIGYKELCPHCLNMEKMLIKYSKTHPDISLFRLNIEESPDTFKELGGERPPTIFVIKNNSIVARKAGLMNPKEMKAFYQRS